MRASKTRRRFRRHRRTQRGGNSNTLRVSYAGQNLNNKERSYANTRQEPDLAFKLSPNKLYTLTMFDPDAPQPGFLHWLFINMETEIPQPYKSAFPYFPPEPPSGKHRYEFTLYEQPTRLVEDLPAAAGPFDLDAFVAAKGLKFVARKSMLVSKEK
jgi:phosphatidylethanolamine-binding protein (PEBP) family uncharacterized protein